MERLGLRVLPWDVRFGPSYDLVKRKHQSLLHGWVLSRAVSAVHLRTPCCSWSRARDRPGGPPPIRSNSLIWGLPGLREADQLKVHVGNVLCKFSASLLFAGRHRRAGHG